MIYTQAEIRYDLCQRTVQKHQANKSVTKTMFQNRISQTFEHSEQDLPTASFTYLTVETEVG